MIQVKRFFVLLSPNFCLNHRKTKYLILYLIYERAKKEYPLIELWVGLIKNLAKNYAKILIILKA